ncbi:MAG: zinc carboxypeptidase, partial [bacterium]|nr:zinc carboxypeptidase [bacterium]
MILSWPAVAGAQAQPPALHILKVTAPDKAAYVRLFQMGLDMPEHLPGPEVLVVGTDAEKEWLEAQGYSVAYELRQATRFFANRALAAGAATMGGFRTLSQSWAAIDSVIAAYPAIVSPKLNIGTTLMGNPIYAIRISDNPQTDESEPAVLITGLHHAREPMSTHIVIYTMQQLTQNYGVDPDITTLVDEREIWFIPIINPDGYEYNEAIAPGGGGMWRKNRKDNGDGSFGVDPNRNYGYAWGWDDAGSSPDPFSETFRGTGP